MTSNDFFILLQVLGTLILVFELVYVLFQKPSTLQKILVILLVTCIFSFISYYFELRATTLESAYFACVFGYASKPFSLFATLLFLAEYSHIKIKRPIIILIFSFFLFLSLTVFTNEFHHLYYTSVNFEFDDNGSGLLLGHGPFWYTYMASSFVLFIAYSVLAFKEFKKSYTKQAKQMTIYVFLMLTSAIIGLACFIFGFTGGYDTTLFGTFFGSIFLLVLLVRYRIFDSLTLAKEKVLSDSNTAVIIFDGRTRVSYFNDKAVEFVEELKKEFFDDRIVVNTLDSYDKYKPIFKNGFFYKLNINEIVTNNKIFDDKMIGKTYEFVDVTDEISYQERLQTEVNNAIGKITSMQRGILVKFANLVEARDGYTGVHIKNVSKYAKAVALDLQRNHQFENIIDDTFVNMIEDCAPLHDVGKIFISDTILGKPAKLTYDEFEIMKTHTTRGNNVIHDTLEGLEEENYVLMAKDIAYYHHEKYDGSGYPLGLKGDNIPLSARIVAIADVYDALRMERPYKHAFSKEESINIIKGSIGTHFDPLIAKAFLNIVDDFD